MTKGQLEEDVVDLLTHDHDVLRRLVTGFGELDRSQWGPKFEKMTAYLVRHEDAEERVVYPALRADTLPGPMVANPLLAEEAEAENLLATLEKLDREGASFASVLDQLQTLVLEHMRDEEIAVFPLIRNLEDDIRRAELSDQYARAMAVAPTHPHPHAPDTPPGNVVLGPIAAVFDRIRDALHARSG
jgi:hemerythrin superfamily protein